MVCAAYKCSTDHSEQQNTPTHYKNYFLSTNFSEYNSSSPLQTADLSLTVRQSHTNTHIIAQM